MGTIFETPEGDLEVVELKAIKAGDIIKCTWPGGAWDYRIAEDILIGKNPGEYAVIGIWFKKKGGDFGGCAIQKGYKKLQRVKAECAESLLKFYNRKRS